MVDRRQFVISKSKIEYNNFETIKLSFGWLSYQKDLHIQRSTDLSGKEWYLLGNAYIADRVGVTPINYIAQSECNELINKTFFWSGRWILIGENQIITDAVGSLGLYYTNLSGEWVISSSLHIIYQLFKNQYSCPEKVLIHDRIKAYPAPDTILNNVYKLLPTQKIIMDNKEVRIEFQNKYRPLINVDDKSKQLAEYIENIIKNLPSKNLELALTSGYDSRVLLAVLLKNNNSFRTFTLEHDTISKGDRDIPIEMAKKLGFNHRYIKRKKSNRVRIEEFYNHTFYTIEETDKDFYVRGQFEEFDSSTIVLKGGILDLIRGSSMPTFDSKEDMKVYLTNKSEEQFGRSLDKWFDWVEQNPIAIDIRDRFTIEQHLGGWLANLQQFTDMLDAEYLQVCNCDAIISLLCSYTEEERRSKDAYKELYSFLYPDVEKFPINPYDRFHMLKYYWNVFKTNPSMAFRKLVKR